MHNAKACLISKISHQVCQWFYNPMSKKISIKIVRSRCCDREHIFQIEITISISAENWDHNLNFDDRGYALTIDKVQNKMLYSTEILPVQFSRLGKR